MFSRILKTIFWGAGRTTGESDTTKRGRAYPPQQCARFGTKTANTVRTPFARIAPGRGARVHRTEEGRRVRGMDTGARVAEALPEPDE